MYECEACKKKIEDGPIVVVSDGVIFNDGELDVQNTEYYHNNCVKIDW